MVSVTNHNKIGIMSICVKCNRTEAEFGLYCWQCKFEISELEQAGGQTTYECSDGNSYSQYVRPIKKEQEDKEYYSISSASKQPDSL